MDQTGGMDMLQIKPIHFAPAVDKWTVHLVDL